MKTSLKIFLGVMITSFLILIAYNISSAQGINPMTDCTSIYIAESGVSTVAFKSTKVHQNLWHGITEGVLPNQDSQITFVDDTYPDNALEMIVLVQYIKTDEIDKRTGEPHTGYYMVSFTDDPDDDKQLITDVLAAVHEYIYIMFVAY